LPGGMEFRNDMNMIEDPVLQISALDQFFAQLIDGEAATRKKVA
jgi:hypothetical protein